MPRYPAADLLPGDHIMRPATDTTPETLVIVKAVLTPLERFGNRMLRFVAEADGRTGIIEYREHASVDARWDIS